MARCSFFSDTFAAPRGASWPFFLAFPGFSSSSALFALHPSGFVTSHEQGFLFCTPFAHPISDELFNTLVAQFVGCTSRSEAKHNRHTCTRCGSSNFSLLQGTESVWVLRSPGTYLCTYSRKQTER